MSPLLPPCLVMPAKLLRRRYLRYIPDWQSRTGFASL